MGFSKNISFISPCCFLPIKEKRKPQVFRNTLLFKALYFLFSLIILTGDFLYAQNTFERVYGGALPEVFHAVIPTSDGGLLLAGSTRSYGNGNLSSPDFYLVKTDVAGDTLWTHTYGSTENDDGLTVRELNDGYVVAGTSTNPLNSSLDIFIVKTDLDGNTIWSNYYGGSGSEYCTDILVLAGNQLLVFGTTTTITFGGFDFYLLKLNSDGSEITSAHYGGSGSDAAYGIRPTLDGGYIMSGLSSSDLTNIDIYLVKTDSELNLQWSRNYGGSGFDIGYDVEQDNDGNYWVLGSWQNGPDSSEIALIKTDTSGLNPVTKYPGTHPGDYGYKLCKVSDGFLLCGYTNTAGKTGEMLLIKTNEEGDTLWSHHYGGTKSEVAFGLCILPDNNIAVAGETEGFGIDNVDGYLVVVNSSGEIPCPPFVSFTMSDSLTCEDETVTFVNTTVSSQQCIWDIDGNSFSGSINTAYYFSAAGSYIIGLSACSSSSSQTINISPKPPTHFIYNIAGQTVTFSIQPSSFTPLTFSWNFGDGSPLNNSDVSPIHDFANPGLYWVILSCVDSNGCDSTYQEQIDLITGANDPQKIHDSFIIYPNPLHDSGNLQLTKGTNVYGGWKAVISDMSGKMLKSFKVSESDNKFTVTGFQPGLYTIALIEENPAGTGISAIPRIKKFIIE